MSQSSPNKRRRLDDDTSSVDDSVIEAFFPPGQSDRDEDDVPVSQISQSNVSVQSHAISQQIQRDDTTCPEHLHKGFMTVNPNLRNVGAYPYQLSLEVFEDEFDLLKLSKEIERTMDSASKSFRLIPRGDDSNYMQPHEGAPICYVERCNSMSVPAHISDVLFFYHSVLNQIKTSGLTGYVIPLTNMSLKKMRNDAKKIVGVFEDIVASNTQEQALYTVTDLREGDMDICNVLQERDTAGAEHLLEREPFTIRVAFTGAFYEVDEETKQELFCIAIITPLKAFNLVTYINDFFTTPPKAPGLKENWCQLDLCFKRIQMFEVNNNCGLICDPRAYRNDLGGKGGFYSVLCILNLPLRIAWILRNMRPENHPVNIRIIGMPKLSFKDNGTMDQYTKYMHAYINEQVEIHDELERNIKVYYSTQEPEQSELSFDNIRSPGGWPLKACDFERDRFEFQRFGLFPFPLVMSFSYIKFVEKPSRESFLLNLGQEPESVMKKKRDFATYDFDVGASSVMPDDNVLTSTELATPLRILEKYYGPNAKPAEDFKDSKLIKWYELVRLHIQGLRESSDIGPDEAFVQVLRHVNSCMEQHVCILKHDSYGSTHFEQCGKMVEKMLDTKLATVSIAANFRFLKTKSMPKSIRHDTYLSASSAMLQSWVRFNKYACLYATNSEAALEIFLSSLLWHLGSHSHTMTSFFQGCLLVSMCGHLEVQIDKHFFIDWRKPNSSGAGAIQVVLNQMMEELGRVFKIMPDENKVVFINPNRNTMAALENECCVITVNTGIAEVKSRPSPDLKDTPLLMLENRGDYSLDTLIRFVFPRDAGQRNVALTTMDLDKTNDRSVALKLQICFPNVSGFCTNQKKGTDEPKSLICVTHVCNPGAPAYFEISDHSGEINRVQCEMSDGRASLPEDTELYILLKQIFFSKIFTSVMVALPHRAGMLPFKINSTTSAFLDWMYMVLRSHFFCVFNSHMIENFGRIKVRQSLFSLSVSSCLSNIWSVTVSVARMGTNTGTLGGQCT